MARSRILRVWTLGLLALCLLAATAGHLSGPSDSASGTTSPSAVGILSPAADAAVLPAKVADEIRVSTHFSTARMLVWIAVLAVLVGLPAVVRRRAAVAGSDHRRLRARRHAISLRAPPLQLA